MNQRAAAASILNMVISQRQSLNDTLPKFLEKITQPEEKAFIKELCFGCLRWYLKLEAIANQLLKTPMKQKNSDVFCLLITGIYQILFLRTPSYAAVSETVNAVKALKKPWAAGLLNKTLRIFLDHQREIMEKIEKDSLVETSHPNWLLNKLKADWPDQYSNIIKANNTKAPLYLRINRQKTNISDFLTKLQTADISASTVENCSNAIKVTPSLPVAKIPGFKEGEFYVQDISGQWAAHLLDLRAKLTVLDCCAAPGSKTTHILELEPNLDNLTAIDNQPNRLLKVRENLIRLQLPHEKSSLVLADASHVEQWWHGSLYDRILLDAPCSATGVIRRHPDIKWLRKETDIENLIQKQALLLNKLWPILKKGGKLLYSTCSVLSGENEKQIKQFCSQHKDAQILNIELPFGLAKSIGWQILPEPNGPDGFYYALLEKK
jgi:16S rRNA (cytosine967-C5)-methyltransferase